MHYLKVVAGAVISNNIRLTSYKKFRLQISTISYYYFLTYQNDAIKRCKFYLYITRRIKKVYDHINSNIDPNIGFIINRSIQHEIGF